MFFSRLKCLFTKMGQGSGVPRFKDSCHILTQLGLAWVRAWAMLVRMVQSPVLEYQHFLGSAIKYCLSQDL